MCSKLFHADAANLIYHWLNAGSHCTELGYICLNYWLSLHVLLLFVQEDEHTKGLPKFQVKFFLHASGNIAAKFSYDPVTLFSIKRREWLFHLFAESSWTILCNLFISYSAYGLSFTFESGSSGCFPQDP